MAYQIISDGSCDLGEKIAKEKNVHVVPFYVSFDEKTYEKEIEETGVRDFYQRMVDNPKVFPKSSLPSIQDYVDAFRVYAEQTIDIICICITTKFSGSFNSANNAKDILQEEYPDIKITVIDAQVNTVLQGIYVLEAVRMRENGLSYEEVVEKLEQIKATGRIMFTVGNIDYLKHGGRIGKLAGIAGSVLGIRPLITLKEGEIYPSGIARSRKRSIAKLREIMLKHFETSGENPKDYVFCIGYGYDYEEACEFRKEVEEWFAPYVKLTDTLMLQIGATIAVHTGPYPLGVGLIRKYDA